MSPVARWSLCFGLALSVGAGCTESSSSTAPTASTSSTTSSPRLLSPAEHRAFLRATATHDLAGARRMLDGLERAGARVERERARLALHLGDCAAALELLDRGEEAEPEVPSLRALAENCLGVTAHATLERDPKAKVTMLWQDPKDRVMSEGVVATVAETRRLLREVLDIDLGTELRVEVVADTFSLARLADLPLESAETTGTVAVARHARVMMLSPRATRSGYPWQDTLCHELVHLAVSRASADQAPVWLHEGLAKLLETGWREGPRAREKVRLERDHSLDSSREGPRARARELSHALVLEAQHAGELPSIESFPDSLALLPSPKSAAYAYAAAHDFLEYLVERHEMAAVRLLLHELGQLGRDSVSRAMLGATGESLTEHTRRWLTGLHDGVATTGPALAKSGSTEQLEERRALRLAELLTESHAHRAVKELLQPLLATQPTSAPLRYWLARAELALQDREAALRVIGTPEQVRSPSGPWFALRGRILFDNGLLDEAATANSAAFALRPELGEPTHSALSPSDATKQRD